MLRRLRVMDRILHPDISQETIGEVLASPDVCRSIAVVFRDERLIGSWHQGNLSPGGTIHFIKLEFGQLLGL